MRVSSAGETALAVRRTLLLSRGQGIHEPAHAFWGGELRTCEFVAVRGGGGKAGRADERSTQEG